VAGPRSETLIRPVEALNAFTRGWHLELQSRFAEALDAYGEALELDPGQSVLLTRIARCELEAGRFDLAAQDAMAAIAADSTDAEAHWVRGLCFAHRDRLEESIPWLRAAARLSPEGDRYAASLIQVLGALGRVDQAEAELEGIMGGAAESARWLQRLGVLLLRQGRDGPALGMLRRVVEKDPQNAEAWEGIAGLEAKAGRTDEAIVAYLEILEIRPDHAEAAMSVLPLLADQARWTEALDVMKILRGEPLAEPEAVAELAGWLVRQGKTPQARALVGSSLEKRPDEPLLIRTSLRIAAAAGSWQEVHQAAERLLAVFPDDPEALHLRAASLADAGRIEEALGAIGTLLDRWPDNIQARLLQGEILHSEGRWEESLGVYEEVLQRDSTRVRALFRSAVAMERLGRIEESLGRFRALLAAQPEHHQALNYAGYMCIEKGIHLEEAIGWVRRALDLSPDSPAYMDSLGWGYFQMGRYPAALQWLRKAVDTGGTEPEILIHLAETLQVMGRPEEAAYWARRVLRGDPDHAHALRILERFEEPAGGP
jgi:tetratricopeptide (TPR) repeat protein